MMKKTIRTTVKAIARVFGFELQAYKDRATYSLSVTRISRKPPPTIPPLFRDPVDALHHVHGQRAASFECELNKCVDINGLSFHEHGWHPFSATLAEYAAGRVIQYEGSTLQRYYSRWQPRNLREALIGLSSSDPSELDQLPAHLVNMPPWDARTAAEADQTVKWACDLDSAAQGCPHISVAQDGFRVQGPMSERAGRLEFSRLVSVYDSLLTKGYRREHGDIRIFMIKRKQDCRFIVNGGIHRVAAMRALGYSTVPARFKLATVFDVSDIERWPHVVDGVWHRGSAEEYINHLFDFDSGEWAKAMGIKQSNA